MVDWETGLIAVRLLAHLVTFYMVAVRYRPEPDARWRVGASLLACVIAGSSLAMVFFTVLIQRPVGGQIFETALAVAFAVIVVLARGNIAKLLPRQCWSTAP